MSSNNITFRGNLSETYSDIYTSKVLHALSSFAHFNKEIKEAMASLTQQRAERHTIRL